MATVVETLVTELNAETVGFEAKMAAARSIADLEAKISSLQGTSKGLRATLDGVSSGRGPDTGGLDAIARRITMLTQGANIEATRGDSLRRLIQIEAALQRATQASNLTLQQRVAIEQQLSRTSAAIAANPGQVVPAFNQAAAASGRVAKGVEAMGSSFGRAQNRITNVAADIAFAGKVSNDTGSRLVDVAADVAFAFGPTGFIVGAVGVSTLAIVRMLQNAREETQKLADEAKKALDDLQDRGDFEGLTKRAETLFKGTPSGRGDGVLDRADGIRILRAELEKLDQQIGAAGVFGALDAKTKEERERIAATLAGMEAEFRETLRRLRELDDASAPNKGLLSGIKVTAPKELEDKLLPDSRLADAGRELDELAKKARETQKAIGAAIGTAAIEVAKIAGDSVGVLNIQIAETTAKFRELGATDAEIAKIVLPLELAKQEAEALNGALTRIDVPKEVQDRLEDAGKKIGERAEQNVKSGDKLALSYEDAANAALGIATALGGANNKLTQALQGAAQLASAFGRIADLAKQAGGIGKLFSSGAGIVAGLSSIGGIIAGIASLSSGLSGLMGGERDPAQQALIDNLAENSRRLEELSAGIVELTLSVSGRDIAGIRDVPLFEEGGQGPRDDLTGESVTEIVNRNIRDIMADLRLAGVSLEDLRQVAADLGLTLSESPTVAELQQIQAALRDLDLTKLFDTVKGLLKLNDIDDQLNPDRSPLESLTKDLEVLAERGPAVFKEVLDLILKGDFEGAKQRIRDFFAELTSGDFDFSSLGDISPEEIFDFLTDIFNGILKAEPKVKTAAQKFRDAVKAYDAELEAGAITAEERAKKIADKAKELFPDLFETVDFSSAEKFKESFANMVAGFAADGEITEAEQQQIDMARLLGESFGYLTEEMDEAEAAAQAFANALSEAFDDIDFDLELRGITDPAERFKRTVDGLRTTWPEMAAIFDQFDLSTAAGRKAAEDAFIAWAQGLTDPAARRAALRVIGQLRDIPGEALAEEGRLAEPTTRQGSGVQTITERTGNALVEFNRVGVRQRDVMIDLLKTIAGAGVALVPPQVGATGAGGGNTYVRVDARVFIEATGDPDALAAAVVGSQSNAIESGVNRALGTRLTDYRQFRGGYTS